MTSRRRLASALDKVFPHLLILLYSLGAAVIYDHHWPFHPSGGLRYIAPSLEGFVPNARPQHLVVVGPRRPCCMDHPEGCLIIVFFNTGDNLDAT